MFNISVLSPGPVVIPVATKTSPILYATPVSSNLNDIILEPIPTSTVIFACSPIPGKLS